MVITMLFITEKKKRRRRKPVKCSVTGVERVLWHINHGQWSLWRLCEQGAKSTRWGDKIVHWFLLWILWGNILIGIKRDMWQNVNGDLVSMVFNGFSYYYYYYFIIFKKCFYFWERGRGRERGREANGGSKGGSVLTAESPMQGLNSQTVRSWPELKSWVIHLTDWTTQVPL